MFSVLYLYEIRYCTLWSIGTRTVKYMGHQLTYTNQMLTAVVLGYYDKTGKWLSVRRLRDVCNIGTDYAARAIRTAKSRRLKNEIEKDPYFAALALGMGMTPKQAKDHLDQLQSRNISPKKGNTHLSRSDLAMILGLQCPELDSTSMTKEQMLERITNPAAHVFLNRIEDITTEKLTETNRRVAQALAKLIAEDRMSALKPSQTR